MKHSPELNTGRRVRNRRVFYIAGFDPLGPRRYRELYRKEAARQAEISGYEIEAGGMPGKGPLHWRAWCRHNDLAAETEFEYLAWHDIVKAQMGRPILLIYWLMLRTLWLYVASGVLFRLMRLRRGPMIAALYPVVVMAAYLLVAALLAQTAWTVVVSLLAAPAWAGWLAAAAGFLGFMAATRRIDRVFMAFYLIDDFAYHALAKGAYPTDLDARLDDFARRILDAWREEEVDEVLVVGHSSGAQLAVSAVMRAVLLGAGRSAGPELSLLTLGQSIPMTSFLPEARELRRDLHLLAQAEEVTWVDITAPADGACFALADPVAVSGVAPPEDRWRWPLVISAAFSHTLSEEQKRYLRWRFFLKHVQYLRCFELPGDYDYFLITAGPVSLSRRFRYRKPSPQRIATPLSRYRSM